MLQWLVSLILNALLTRLTRAAVSAAQQIEKDRQQGKVNDENVKAYQEAQTRAEKVKAALSMLNGTHSS